MRIRRALAAALVTFLLSGAGMAAAATYYVSPTGSATSAGTPAAPWSLAKANASLVAGDVAILAPGDYGAATIAPARSGTSYANFIAYVGSLADPASTLVGGVSFGSRSYVSVKGVTFAGDVTFLAPRDSLTWCVATAGDLNARLGGDDCVAAHCTFNGSMMGFSGGTNGAAPAFLYRDSLIDCTFDLYHTETNDMAAVVFLSTYGTYVSGCRFLVEVAPAGNKGMMKMYGVRHAKFVDCLFDLTSNRPLEGSDEANWVYFRDYFMFNHFLRDTFRVHGPYITDLMLTASGSYPATTRGNKYEACVFRHASPASWSAVRFQDAARADTMIGCTIVSGAGKPALDFYGLGDSCLFRGNTLATLGGERVITSDWGSTHLWTGKASFADNIVYSAPTAAGSVALSLGNEITGRHWVGSRNLFYCKNPASSSVQVANMGLMAPGPAGGLCANYGTDCTSLYGDPRFTGGTDALSFDVSLTAGSPAIGAASGGGDIGAVPFVTAAPDDTPPGAVTDLASALVGANRVLLTWTATGDDGGSGQAAAYELRMSDQPLAVADFDGATPVPNSMTPQVAGLAEQFAVEGLAAATTYYFALRVTDEASNASAVSNVLAVTTAVSDTIPPALIQDLR